VTTRSALLAAMLPALILLAGAPAIADSRKLMVLPSDGRADGKLKVKIDGAIAKLAKASGETVAIGEVSYNDMAAAVGCKPDEASCRDEVIATLAVDEIVITSVNPKPGGFDVSVRRVSKGGAPRDASTLVTADKAEQLDAIAPLFGKGATASAPAAKPAVTAPQPAKTAPTPQPAKTAPTPTPAVTAPKAGPPPPPATPQTTTTTTTNSPPPGKVFGPPPAPAPEPQPDPFAATAPPPKPAPARVAQVTPPVEPMPGERSDKRARRVPIVGMAVGTAMLVTGFVLWGKTSDLQDQVDNFPRPIRNRAQLEELQDLENQGDTYATWRTVMVVGGLAVGGVSTYLFVKGRRARGASQARIVPTLFDHGAGLAFTIGGSP